MPTEPATDPKPKPRRVHRKKRKAGRPPRKGKAGRPQFMPTKSDRAQIEMMVAMETATIGQMAQLKGINEKTFRKHFKFEIETGRARIMSAVGGNMVRQAVKNDFRAVPAATKILEGKGILNRKTIVDNRVSGSLATYDVSKLDVDQLKAFLAILDQITVPGSAEGDDPEEGS